MAFAQVTRWITGAPAGSGRRTKLERAPLPERPRRPARQETRVVAERVAAEMRFFHWELEFPDVFREAGSGVRRDSSATRRGISLQPVSKEFFSDIDPLYRSYGKQEALRKQTRLLRQRNYASGAPLARLRQHRFAGAVELHGSCTASPFGDPAVERQGSGSICTICARCNRNRSAS